MTDINGADDAWHVRLPRRLRASVDKIAIAEDRHPASVVRRLLIRALAERSSDPPQASDRD